jgi:hypothetical protein
MIKYQKDMCFFWMPQSLLTPPKAELGKEWPFSKHRASAEIKKGGAEAQLQ